MYCICCKKNNVTPTGGSLKIHDEDVSEEDLLWKCNRKSYVNININNEMIDNGIIQILNAGYGSSHDGEEIIIAICDDCIKTNLEDATLLYYSNNMGSSYTNKNVAKSKKKYRRRKNLDNLTD